PAGWSAPAPRRLEGACLGVFFDDERIVVVGSLERSLDAPPVDEDGGGGFHPEPRARVDVGRDAAHRAGVVETGAEGGDVETEIAPGAEQTVAVEGLLILEEHVVVLPETPLASCALRGGGGQTRVGMELLLHAVVAAAVEGKVPEDQLHVRPGAHEVAEIAEGVAA